MDESSGKKKVIGRPFEKGNKLAVGHKHKPYQARAREFAETKGWDKLEMWAQGRNSKASIAALTIIFAYAYGKPREQLRVDTNLNINIQQWFLSVHRGSLSNPTPPSLPGTSSPGSGMVLPAMLGDTAVGKTDGNNSQHSSSS